MPVKPRRSATICFKIQKIVRQGVRGHEKVVCQVETALAPKNALFAPVVMPAPVDDPVNMLFEPPLLIMRWPAMLYWVAALTAPPDSVPLAVPLPLMLKLAPLCSPREF